MQVPRGKATDAWQDPELVFTSAYGIPYEPRNFNRQFAVRCQKAGVLTLLYFFAVRRSAYRRGVGRLLLIGPGSDQRVGKLPCIGW
jgi:hypothetical protein